MALKKKTEKNSRKKKSSFWSRLSDDRKSSLLKYAGWTMSAFAVISLISVLSYLFTWQADQSLMSRPDMMDKAVDVQNWCGKLGYRWSSFLVTDCFGLGSFALLFLFCAIAYRLFYWKKSIGLVKMTFVSVLSTFVSSLILAFFSARFGADTFFGGGLGGYAGSAVVQIMENLLGAVGAGLIIVLLTVALLLFASGRFETWFAAFGEGRLQEEYEPETETDVDPADEMTDVIPENDLEEELDAEPEDVSDDMTVVDEESSEEYDPIEILPVEDTVSQEESEMEVIVGEELSTDIKEELPWIDVREELERFQFPPLDLLNDYSEGKREVSKEELELNNNRIRTTLLNYKIKVDKVSAVVGPTVTLYKVVPAPGVKISAIENLRKEIGLSLGAKGVRVVTLADSVGIEVANNHPSIVPLKAMLNDDAFRNSKAELPVAIGYTITQKVKTFDLTDAPHLLVAGATKQGKSVGLNVIISSLLYAKHPSELKFVFIDPKMVEFTAYNSLLKHYLAVLPLAASEEDEKENAIIKQPKQAENVLNSLCIEMDERYKLLAAAGVNDIKLYNAKYKERHLLPTEGHKHLPYLVVVIDEYADLTMAGGSGGDARKTSKNISDYIVRLAQKGRAAGIHVIIATQRPSVNVITGLIKTNFPTRIAFRVVGRVDSQTILDTTGAENLIGRGDMLYYAGVEMERVQCALVSMAEINKITDFIGAQTGFRQCYSTPYYLPVPESQDGETSGGTIDMQNIDPMFEDAARMVVTSQKGSTSDLQRRLGMGYARAGRVMDQLEAAGVVGPQEGSKPRQVLVTTFNELDEILAAFVKD
ncbi:MAG: DNA translocase FtsK 4TM domain-containing protein [Bacteroidales bacterium]|nr:DNA translocase FtsK 4TM domain-containing protein [Bacteroidales bacterium]MBQ5603029.1 DNA translocase FtsK 4TM domain-containing protein [Bacteroidales bacterium]